MILEYCINTTLSSRPKTKNYKFSIISTNVTNRPAHEPIRHHVKHNSLQSSRAIKPGTASAEKISPQRATQTRPSTFADPSKPMFMILINPSSRVDSRTAAIDAPLRVCHYQLASRSNVTHPHMMACLDPFFLSRDLLDLRLDLCTISKMTPGDGSLFYELEH